MTTIFTMNIKLAELINSVPNDYKETNRSNTSRTFTHKNKEIYICWYASGQPYSISYKKNGKYHKPHTEGPAYQDWHENGQPCRISYYEKGNYHRPHTDGPANQSWYDNGQPRTILYYENGVEIK